MENYYATLISRTQKIVKRYRVSQVKHFYFTCRSYVDSKGDKTDRHPGTISRRMTGKVLPPWDLVTHYAGHGTRCPKVLVEDLCEYIADHYNTQALRDALRMTLLDVLATLPKEDQEDISDYWDDHNLANMWAVLTWYCVTNDYAVTTWSA